MKQDCYDIYAPGSTAKGVAVSSLARPCSWRRESGRREPNVCLLRFWLSVSSPPAPFEPCGGYVVIYKGYVDHREDEIEASSIPR